MANERLISEIRSVLRTARPAGVGGDILGAGLVRGISVSPSGVAKVIVDTSKIPAEEATALLHALTEKIGALAGVARAVVAAAPRNDAQSSQAGGHSNPLGLGVDKKDQKESKSGGGDGLRRVKRVISVTSGKGGVGKSTIAAYLARALAAQGYKTGLLDADIYGPSLATLFGVANPKPTVIDGMIQPIIEESISLMSIGFLVAEEKALAWRGPMVMGALKQLLNDVDWGALDILVIDTPPGTGDVQLSLAQSKRVDGAIIVSTPQEMALADVRRGVEFLRKTSTEILGVVENMAWLDTPNGERLNLFGSGGAKAAAAQLGAPFLGEVPIFPDLRKSADAGEPLKAEDPAFKWFESLAKELAIRLDL